LSITEEQLETLGDDDLCLFNNRVRRVYDRRMMKRNGNKQGCFECGEPGHFVADCPKRNDYYKKGNGGGSFDSGNHSKPNDYRHRSKGGSRRKFLKKSFRDFHKGNKQREKAFFAELQANLPSDSTSSSSSSSSSDEEIAIKGKKKDKGGPAGLCFVSSGHKQRRRHSKSRKSLCTMAHEDKDDDCNDDSGSDSEVTDEQIYELLAENDRQLKMQDELLRKGRKKIDKLTEKLAAAKSKIESLSSAQPNLSEVECPSCERLLSDLTCLKSRYTERVEERDTLATELEDARKELRDAQAPVVEDVEPCEACPHLESEIADLKKRCGDQVRELERLKSELEARPVLLGACKVCPTLREELEQARADCELLSVPSTVCEACLSLRMELAEQKAQFHKLEKSALPSKACEVCCAKEEVLGVLREEKESAESENTYLRQILSWVSSREPQLGMMIQQFKRENGFGVGYKYTQADFDSAVSKAMEWSRLRPEDRFPKTHATETFQPDQPSEGVFHEKPKAPPKNPAWIPKPKILQTSLDSTPPTKPSPKTTKPKAKKPKPQPQPKPKSWPETFVCDHCHHQGHLEEFCFRRKRALRLERERAEQSHQQGGGQRVPRRAERREARARRVGGGRGDDFLRRAPGGGRFAGRAPGRSHYGPGPRGRGVEQFGVQRFESDPRFIPYCSTASTGFAFPTFEQMARHWFSSFANPSVGPFAHPSYH